MTPWDILGLSSDASPPEIKQAYARLVKNAHPEEDPEGFQRLHEAYTAALRQARRRTAETVQSAPQPHREQEPVRRPAQPVRSGSDDMHRTWDYERLMEEGERDAQEQFDRHGRLLREKNASRVRPRDGDWNPTPELRSAILLLHDLDGAPRKQWESFLTGELFLSVKHTTDFLFHLEEIAGRQSADVRALLSRRYGLKKKVALGRYQVLCKALGQYDAWLRARLIRIGICAAVWAVLVAIMINQSLSSMRRNAPARDAAAYLSEQYSGAVVFSGHDAQDGFVDTHYPHMEPLDSTETAYLFYYSPDPSDQTVRVAFLAAPDGSGYTDNLCEEYFRWQMMQFADAHEDVKYQRLKNRETGALALSMQFPALGGEASLSELCDAFSQWESDMGRAPNVRIHFTYDKFFFYTYEPGESGGFDASACRAAYSDPSFVLEIAAWFLNAGAVTKRIYGDTPYSLSAADEPVITLGNGESCVHLQTDDGMGTTVDFLVRFSDEESYLYVLPSDERDLSAWTPGDEYILWKRHLRELYTPVNLVIWDYFAAAKWNRMLEAARERAVYTVR